MKKALLLLGIVLIFLIGINSACAEELSVHIENERGKDLEGAFIILQKLDGNNETFVSRTITNRDGNAKVIYGEGEYRIVAFKPTYKNWNKRISSLGSNNVDIELEYDKPDFKATRKKRSKSSSVKIREPVKVEEEPEETTPKVIVYYTPEQIFWMALQQIANRKGISPQEIVRRLR